jgi:predicted ATPase
MIRKIHIKNFKSIYDLEFEVGRVNLFIGENGSGKSNLLEALVFISASNADKLDNEFLTSRGIRVTAPELMRSAFDEESKDKSIIIGLEYNGREFETELVNQMQNYSKWVNLLELDIADVLNEYDDLKNELSNKKFSKTTEIKFDKVNSKIESLLEKRDNYKKTLFKDFIIFSPENTALRNFYKEGQIEPLGINGEGLLKLLRVVNNYEDKSYIETIIKSLQLFNWFEDIEIPDKLSSSEDKITITDRYLYKNIDQRSANEGFLFILFYITLIVAKETPKVFAIDNIDASLNPKLCTKLMTLITELAQKYDKQIFLTTHNPAILDGIDLNDKEQKLFIVSRNKSGYTRLKNITVKDKPKSSDDEPLNLSEAFLRGYLGGLPKGF